MRSVPELEAQFYQNLDILISKWNVKLEELDASRLTRRILVDNPCVTFVKHLVDLAKKYKTLNIVTAEGQYCAFEDPKYVTIYLSTGNQTGKREACIARGIAIPVPAPAPAQKPSQLTVVAKKSSTVTPAHQQDDSLIQQELALLKERYEHVMKEADLLRREQDLTQKRLERMTESHAGVEAALVNIEQKHTEACTEMAQLKIDLESKEARLSTEVRTLREQHEKTKTNVEKSAAEVLDLKSRLAKALKTCDERIQELVELKNTFSSTDERFKTEKVLLMQEVASRDEKLRVLQEQNRGLKTKNAEFTRKTQQLEIIPEVMGYLQLAMGAIRDGGFVPLSETESVDEAVRHSGVVHRTRAKLGNTAGVARTVAGSADGFFSSMHSPVEKHSYSQSPLEKEPGKRPRLTSKDGSELDESSILRL